MKISAITIFPEYFTPLSISLIGKAASEGLIEVDIYNLRDFASGNHKSVDDTPYGGGAGMVMRPDIWGDAIDSISKLKSESESDFIIDLIILTPAGKRFDQADATALSQSKHLLFAAGRYEGIDARVGEYYKSQPRFRVHYFSIGDYVLNGGEVAALVMIEAIVRLLPGVLGNPDSLLEESHNEIGVLEYPIYTKPAIWRGLEVPPVLLSGNHGEIARWREISSKTRG
jgi:tRNA (guanine37-N1)-methyltransferase